MKKSQPKLQMNTNGTLERRQDIREGLLQTGLADIAQVDFDILATTIGVNMQIGNALKEADRTANFASQAFEEGKGPEQEIDDRLNSYFYFDALLELMGADASANGLIFDYIPLKERDGSMYRFRANAWKCLQKYIDISGGSYENSIYSDKDEYKSQIFSIREQIQKIFENMQGRHIGVTFDIQPRRMIYLLFTNLSKSLPLHDGMFSFIHLDYLNKIKHLVIQSIVENLLTVEEAKALILLSGRVSIDEVNKFFDFSEIEKYRESYS